MAYKRYRVREVLTKIIQCRCGGESKLIKRRNFPHGRKSQGQSYSVYKCNACSKEVPLNKSREAKK